MKRTRTKMHPMYNFFPQFPPNELNHTCCFYTIYRNNRGFKGAVHSLTILWKTKIEQKKPSQEPENTQTTSTTTKKKPHTHILTQALAVQTDIELVRESLQFRASGHSDKVCRQLA